MDEADLLLDRPPGGWDDLVTKDWLHLELEARLGPLEARMASIERRFGTVDSRFDTVDSRFDTVDRWFDKIDSRFDKIDSRFDEIARELRSQTWRLMTILVAGMGIAIAANRF
jgi:hypothetical protein